jgi:hypothetical protein
MPTPNIHIFGIRHHGPGCARSLAQALTTLQPDCVLVEGPPDAESILPLLIHEQMRPPVALLIYAPDNPQRAVYYPFTGFSPEWQALRYALSHQIPVRFMDLPQTYRLATDITIDPTAAQSPESDDPTLPVPLPTPHSPPPTPHHDPLGWLAQAAGYSDSERWWEHLVEQRRDSTDLFAAILEAMTVLRAEVEKHVEDGGEGEDGGGGEDERDGEGEEENSNPSLSTPQSQPRTPNSELRTPNPQPLLEAQREAYMRKTIREAEKQGFQRIAVVCGAWHAPVLAQMPPAKDDNALLKGLPKLKVEATWVPWTYGRLLSSSGYGAGIESPGWYHHLWEVGERQQAKGKRQKAEGSQPSSPSPSLSQTSIRWMTRVVQLLRKKDLDASSASVIEAVRLAETLAALRDRPLPGLPELNEATQTVLCFGDPLPMQLIHDQLIVGERLGKVPQETPMVPLQQDLQRQQKRLRLKPEATETTLELDLRKPLDLERSHLLHRLALLSIRWGKEQGAGNTKGTFREVWRLKWQPEFVIRLIEAGVWGNTIAGATTACTCDSADHATLPELTQLIDQTLLANLPSAIAHLMHRLQAEAALASDITHLMAALPPLVTVMRYGTVRQIETGIVGHVVDGLVARICIGLPVACSSLDDEAAATLYGLVVAVHGAISLLQHPDHLDAWQRVLAQLADQQGLHGLLAGRCCRLLFEAGVFAAEDTAQRLGLALSTANDPAQAAAWIEGFLKGSGLLLLHNPVLWQVLDDWVIQLTPDSFIAILPLLRRTFSTFPAPERRQMGEQVRQGSDRIPILVKTGALDRDRADAILPLITQLLGIS